MAFTWTNLPVDSNTKVTIAQLNEIYSKINTARTASGISGSVSSGKSSSNDQVTAADIINVRAEIDYVSDNYNTGCSTFYTTYLRTNNNVIDFTVNSSVNSTDCTTVYVSNLVTINTTKNGTYKVN